MYIYTGYHIFVDLTEVLMDISKFCVRNGKNFELLSIKCDDSLGYTKEDRPKVERMLAENTVKIAELQDKLYAQNTNSLLMILQATDAAGKDGTIKHVTSGLNPRGCHVRSFKAPSSEELDHDYLWRINRHLPERGTIGIFNRSHYEEVLVAKIHDLPSKQQLPKDSVNTAVWKNRYRQINDYEKYLDENGIIIIKIFLHLSKDEQKKRILARIDDPAKNWKFCAGDLNEREYWDAYQKAFEDMIRNTATSYAPWYVVPADRKWFARTVVSEILLETLEKIDPEYPSLPEDQQKLLSHYREILEAE